jgi:hypothetical protein
MRALIESPDGVDAEMRQVVTKLFEILSTQHLHFARIGAARHAEHCASMGEWKAKYPVRMASSDPGGRDGLSSILPACRFLQPMPPGQRARNLCFDMV